MILVDGAQRPKANLNVSSSQTDLILEILDLLGNDPDTAFAGLVNEQDSMSLLLSTISTLTVKPSPDAIRHKAARTVGLLVDHLADPASGTRENISLVSSAGEAV